MSDRQEATHDQTPRLPEVRGREERSARQTIVLAGGRGTRLARMTRRMIGVARPKQFCAFAPDDATLLQRTVERARRLTDGPIRVVVGREHHALAEDQLAAYDDCRLIVQSADRGTAVGLLIALVDLLAASPRAHVLVLPADHGFRDESALVVTVDDAFSAVRANPERVVLLAAEADRAATDYGWIVPASQEGTGPQPIARFVEKPDRETARRLLRCGAAWSTMMMVGTGRRLLRLFARATPRLVRLLVPHTKLPRSEAEASLERAVEALRPVDLSADILERAGDLWMLSLPRAAGWSDLGTEERMQAWMSGRRAPRQSGVRAAARSVDGKHAGEVA